MTFTELLATQRNGAAVADIDRVLGELLEAVQATGKRGSLTVTLTVEPPKDSKVLVVVKDDIRAKLPQPGKEGSLFFIVTENGRCVLSRRNPDQPELPFQQDASPQLKKLAGGQ
jgi:hypothetical protein